MLLMAEMSLFVVLIVPLPFNLKRKIFTYVLRPTTGFLLSFHDVYDHSLTFFSSPSFLSENPLIAKVQYGMKITFIFILILFIDSVNRVYRVQIELGLSSENGANGYVLPTPTLFSFLPFLLFPC